MKKIFYFLLLSLPFSLNAQNLQSKLLFSHHNSAASTDPDSIYTISNQANMNFITLGYRPRLSTSARYMLFSNGPQSNSSYQANLWIRDMAARSDAQIVPSNNDSLDYYDFMPDEQKIVYAQGCSIYKANIDGSSPTAINSTPDCQDDDPQVNRKDSVILFHDINSGLWTMNFDGSSPTLIPNTSAGDLYPAWAPDHKHIAYIKIQNGHLNNLFRIRSDGAGFQQMTNLAATDSIAPGPVWASDTNSVFFIARIKDTLGIYQVGQSGTTINSVWKFDGSGSVMDYWLGVTDSVRSTLLLPITLSSFTGALEGKFVQLKWQTSQEINSSYFDVERSTDGNSFAKIGSVAASGNTSVPTNYSYADYQLPLSPLQQSLFYRLKSVDKDGNYSYSNEIVVNILPNTHVGIFPNPSPNGTFQFVTNNVNKKVDVMVTDASGRKIYQNSFYNTSSGLVHLPQVKGIYFVKINGDKESFTQKVVLQ